MGERDERKTEWESLTGEERDRAWVYSANGNYIKGKMEELWELWIMNWANVPLKSTVTISNRVLSKVYTMRMKLN